MKKYVLRVINFPLTILLLGLIGFGSLSHKLGLYWDDWPSIWFLHNYGPRIFPEAFMIDRPLQGWLFVLTSSLLGESVFAWQVFGILARCLSAVMLFWVLRTLWPQKTQQAGWIALLFVLYPGFGQQYITITYSHQLIILSIFLFSLYTMLMAQRAPGWFWPLTILSIFSAAATMFMLEYFVGLELLRPALLWIVLGEASLDVTQRLRRTALAWSPYLFMLAAFVAWRLLNPTPRGKVVIFDNLRDAPLATLLERGQTILGDIFEAAILAWARVLDLAGLSEYDPLVVARYFLTILATAGLAYLLLSQLIKKQALEKGDAVDSRRKWARQAIFLGLYALAVGGIPVWATDLKIALEFPWDRFTLLLMLGGCMLLVGALEALTRQRRHSVAALAVVLGLACGYHFRNALAYREEWLAQRDFIWQLVWRAPDIEPGTLLLTAGLPFGHTTDNSLTAALNWTYAPENKDERMPYLLYDVETRLGEGLADLKMGTPVYEPYRVTYFEGSTSQALVIIYQPPGCLKVFNPLLDWHMPDKPSPVRRVLDLSNPALVLNDPQATVQPPERFFGQEPAHNWCYTFQKADLARQEQDWETIIALGDQGLPRPLYPLYSKNVVEAAPFIEAYAHTGNWKEAVNLTVGFYNYAEKNQPMLCELWKRIHESIVLDEKGEESLEKVRKTLQCAAP